MKYSEACIELAKLIQAGHYKYEEEAGLAIQVMHDSINDGDDPAMSLALAKNLDVAACASAQGKCYEAGCDYFGHKKASSCRCSKSA